MRNGGALLQERRTPTCGSRFGNTCTDFIKKAHWWKSKTSKQIAPKKEMLELSLFEEKFTTEGNEKADEPAREVVRLDGGNMAQVRGIPIQQE